MRRAAARERPYKLFDVRLESLLACHEAVASFGGRPREALCDNRRAVVVVGREAYGPGLHHLQPDLRDFTRHHGFLLRLCRPCRAATNGEVERLIRQVRQDFRVPQQSRLRPPGLRPDVAAASVEVRGWLRDVANRRIHATAGRVSMEALAEKRGTLLPLAAPWPGLVLRAAAAPVIARPTSRPMEPVIQHLACVREDLLAPGMLQRTCSTGASASCAPSGTWAGSPPTRRRGTGSVTKPCARTWFGRSGRNRRHEPSFNHRHRRFGCRAVTLRCPAPAAGPSPGPARLRRA